MPAWAKWMLFVLAAAALTVVGWPFWSGLLQALFALVVVEFVATPWGWVALGIIAAAYALDRCMR